jgi:outer membrane immunogenic protein
MRSAICALALLALPTAAYADGFNILRGTVPTYNWSGFYAGGQFGYSSSVVKFGTAASSQVAFLLRNTTIEQDEQISQWSVLGTHDASNTGFGGFVGYNTQWESVIIGFEANYNRVNLSKTAGSSLSRSFNDATGLPTGHSYFYDVTVGGSASVHMTDIATFRLRAGAMEGNFLPYAFLGLAVGRASTSTSASVALTAVDQPTPPATALPPLADSGASTNTQNNAIAYGAATGLGVDIGLLPNVFLRGELEYIYFAPLNGIQLSIASARAGAGVKF